MGLPINIVGLNEFIKDIIFGSIILVEGNIEPIKSIFVQNLGIHAQQNNYDVNFISSRAKEEIIEQVSYLNKEIDFNVIEERSSRHWKDFLKKKSILIIDSFSYLVLEDSIIDVRNILEELDSLCKKKSAIIILTVEHGMLDEKVRITVGHLADGIIQFLSRDTTDGVARFIRIPKWVNRKSFDENIFYQFDGKRINVDLRARVR
jgi:archaellum biogenesis ATPase FlaH